MHLRVVFGVEDREEDQSCRASDREEDRKNRTRLVKLAFVGC